MIVICISATADRFHGFLRLIMLNPHLGLYASKDVNKAARERIWSILSEWHATGPRGRVVMIYPDKSRRMRIDFLTLGAPKREIVEIDTLCYPASGSSTDFGK